MVRGSGAPADCDLQKSIFSPEALATKIAEFRKP